MPLFPGFFLFSLITPLSLSSAQGWGAGGGGALAPLPISPKKQRLTKRRVSSAPPVQVTSKPPSWKNVSSSLRRCLFVPLGGRGEKKVCHPQAHIFCFSFSFEIPVRASMEERDGTWYFQEDKVKLLKTLPCLSLTNLTY